MSDPISVSAGDRGLIWVFAIDLDDKAAAAFSRRNGTWPAQEALGAEILNPDHVEVFPLKNLEGVGLTGYLKEGLGVPSDQTVCIEQQLDDLEGWVMVLSARAFGGHSQSFTPRAPLRLLASFSEQRSAVSFEPLKSKAATGSVENADSATVPTRAKQGWGSLLLVGVVLLAAILGVWGILS